MSFIPNSNSEFLPVDTRNASGTIVLPIANTIPTRQIIFKDAYGSFATSSLRLSTQYGNSFEDGTTTMVLQDTYGYGIFTSDGDTRWILTDGTFLPMYSISTVNSSKTINVNVYTNTNTTIQPISSILLQDASTVYPMYLQSSFLYYGSTIVAGTKTGSAQFMSVI